MSDTISESESLFSLTSKVKLEEITISHFSKLLSKLFLSAPEIIGKETNPCNWQSYYTVLRCSKLYMDKFQDISPEQVCVIINENEEIINITSVDETVSLYDINYPCTVCLCQVTWDQNDTGNGLRCDTCHNWYHNSCAPPEFQFSLELLKCLDGGPPANLCVFCPKCMDKKKPVTMERVASELCELRETVKSLSTVNTSQERKDPLETASLVREMKELKEKLGGLCTTEALHEVREKIDKISKPLERVPEGSTLATNFDVKKNTQAMKTELGTYANLATKNHIKERENISSGGYQLANSKGKATEYNPTKTVIITGHKDQSLNATRKMKIALWELFPNYGIVLAYPSPLKGTLTYQFSTEKEAKEVMSKWKSTNFGGDTKAVQPMSEKVYGVLKDTPLTWTNTEAGKIIEDAYGKDSVDHCRRIKINNKDTHVIMVKFKENKHLARAVKEGLKVGKEKLNFEESYGKQKTIVRCFRCQEFGKHVARLCPNKQKCLKCSEEHQGKDCHVTEADEKCANCRENHRADSASCDKFQEYKEKMKAKTSRW